MVIGIHGATCRLGPFYAGRLLNLWNRLAQRLQEYCSRGISSDEGTMNMQMIGRRSIRFGCDQNYPRLVPHHGRQKRLAPVDNSGWHYVCRRMPRFLEFVAFCRLFATNPFLLNRYRRSILQIAIFNRASRHSFIDSVRFSPSLFFKFLT